MTKWLLFSALWWVTGNPLLALVVMLLAAWAADRAFVGLLPDPFRRLRALLARRDLYARIANNPHDGPALLSLGRDAVERFRHRTALPLLRRALERMPEESEAIYLLALAEIGCGEVEAGLARLRELLTAQPRYRFGEPWLEAGARLLSRKRDREAVEALKGFVQFQPGSVRGHYLLAVALHRVGEAQAARAQKKQAWQEFVTLPRFKRKSERRYAWMANPRRPLLYVALGLTLSLVLALGLMSHHRQPPSATGSHYRNAGVADRPIDPR